MSGIGANDGRPEFEQTESTVEQAAADQLTSGARDLAYQPGDKNTAEAEGQPSFGDASIGASIIAHWARTAQLFDGKANAEALNNYRDRLDPSFVVALEWAQQDPDAIRKFLGSMQDAVG